MTSWIISNFEQQQQLTKSDRVGAAYGEEQRNRWYYRDVSSYVRTIWTAMNYLVHTQLTLTSHPVCLISYSARILFEKRVRGSTRFSLGWDVSLKMSRPEFYDVGFTVVGLLISSQLTNVTDGRTWQTDGRLLVKLLCNIKLILIWFYLTDVGLNVDFIINVELNSVKWPLYE